MIAPTPPPPPHPMKLIHLSDLHLGKRVHEVSMLPEQILILNQILQIVDEEQPQALLVCGDVYDKTVPSGEAVTAFDDFLCRLAQRKLPVFIISGNHDSPERLAFGGRLMDLSGIHFSPVYSGDIRPITLRDEYGPVHFWLLPFLQPAHIRRFSPEEAPESYTDALRVAIGRMAIDAKERNVLLQGQAKTKASERQTDAIIDSVASIVGNALGEVFEDQADLISTAVTEAGKFINMVRSYCNDKSSVREYFEKRGEISRLKGVMEKELPGTFQEEDSLDLIRQARGYENYTEMASFVGLNVTRSLLFCASPFNRQESLRIVALATLGVLGMEDVIGNCDNQSAERVYEAIMGGEYR